MFKGKFGVKREEISLVQYKNNISEWKVTIKVQNVCVILCLPAATLQIAWCD